MNNDNNILNDYREDWMQALNVFSKTSGLIISLYQTDGTRICGPYSDTPLGQTLIQTGKFNEGELCHYSEKREVIKVALEKQPITYHFSNSLSVEALPLIYEGKIIGILSLGWIFDHFPDPIESDRLAKALGIPGNHCWQVVRMQSPTSQEKLSVYKDMLNLLCQTLLKQLFYLRDYKIASKMKDELLAVVSHELKTPLTSILLRIQMLRSGKIPESKMDSFLESMENSAKIEAKLIDDLLDAAKIVTGKFHFEQNEILLDEVLRAAVDTVTDSALAKKLVIMTEGLEIPLPLKGDTIRLTQAFINLLNNAVKFTPEGGKIIVQLRRDISHYLIKITDTGIGIDKDFLPHLFDRFSQEGKSMRSVHSGLGLGLALVRSIIDHHGGKIEVESKGKDQGTTFEIRLKTIGH